MSKKTFGMPTFASFLTSLIRGARVPLLANLVVGMALSMPAQTIEIYKVWAAELRNGAILRTLLCVVLVVATVASVYASTRLSLHKSSSANHSRRAVARTASSIAIIIPVCLAIGLNRARIDSLVRLPADLISADPNLTLIITSTHRSMPILLMAALALVVASVIFVLFGSYSFRRRTLLLLERAFLSEHVGISIGAAVVLLIFYFMSMPIAGAQALGSLNIVLIFVLCATWIGYWLKQTLGRFGLSAAMVVALAVVSFSYLDWNYNHAVRSVPRSAEKLPLVDDKFKEWYRSRPDRGFYRDRPYPVFVVGAAGGGIYATYHAAAVLARLQDRCPTFAQHVFAISGVSGGSIGSSIFASLVSDPAIMKAEPACAFAIDASRRLEAKAREMAGTDYLSPVVAAGLFPDAIQKLLPFPVGAFDRARALEYALEVSWDRVGGAADNPYRLPFLKTWKATGSSPALMLNTTSTTSGVREVIMPFEFSLDRNSIAIHNISLSYFRARNSLLDYQVRDRRAIDVRLSTAAALSARFPWILPSGGFDHRASALRVDDGGLFEKSGVETAMDLIQVLRKYETTPPHAGTDENPSIALYLLVIDAVDGVNVETPDTFDEALSPVSAMLRVRQRRGNLAQFRALSTMGWCFLRDMYNTGSVSCPGNRVILFLLNLHDLSLPLGWQLSRDSISLVDWQIGDLRPSSQGSDPNLSARDARMQRAANSESQCAVAIVLQNLISEKQKPCDSWPTLTED